MSPFRFPPSRIPPFLPSFHARMGDQRMEQAKKLLHMRSQMDHIRTSVMRMFYDMIEAAPRMAQRGRGGESELPGSIVQHALAEARDTLQSLREEAVDVQDVLVVESRGVSTGSGPPSTTVQRESLIRAFDDALHQLPGRPLKQLRREDTSSRRHRIDDLDLVEKEFASHPHLTIRRIYDPHGGKVISVHVECQDVLSVRIAVRPCRAQDGEQSVLVDHITVIGVQEGDKNKSAWMLSRFAVFRKVTEHANQAFDFFQKQGSGLRAFLTWVDAYHNLFTTPCHVCHKLLGYDSAEFMFLPPTLRHFQTLHPYHPVCASLNLPHT